MKIFIKIYNIPVNISVLSDLTFSLFQGVQGIMEMTTTEMETIIEKASDLSSIADIFTSPFIMRVLSVRTVLNVSCFMTPSFPLCFKYGFFFHDVHQA